MLDKVTFDEHENVLKRYRRGDISYIFTKLDSLKSLILYSVAGSMQSYKMPLRPLYFLLTVFIQS